MKRIAAALTIGTVLALVLAACGGGGVVDAGPLEDREPDTGTEADDDTEPPAETEEPNDTEPQTDDTEDADNGTDRDDDRADDTDDGSTTDSDGTRTIRLYYVAPGGDTSGRAGPFLVSVQREIPATPGIAQATLRELIAGPSAADRALIDGISTSVPADTLVLGINIDDGLATVDLSREFESGGGSFSMFSRLAQVIYTVTQFPTVDEVEFMLDGQPVTVFSGEGIEIDGPASRDDLVDLLPTVFVDAPAAGAEVAGGSLRMTGMAAVFEATFQYRLEAADGTVLDEGFAMTDNGVGWGSFDITIDYDINQAQDATLTVWEYSAKDGSVQAERVTPLVLLP
jgi:germination protein M